MRFALLHIPLFLYLFVRLILPLPISRWAKTVWTILLLLVSQHYLIRNFFGILASPEMPRWLIRFEGACFGIVIFLFVLVLGRDIFRLVRWLLRRKATAPARFSPARRAFLFTAAAAVPAVYGVAAGTGLPGVHRMERRFVGLNPDLDGLSIVHLTDLHISKLFPEGWTADLVERVNSLQADMILFTGDMVDGTADRRTADVAPLAGLKARYGVFGCPGNHEYYGGYRSWMRAFNDLGIRMLENETVEVPVRGAFVAISGMTDVVAQGFGLPMPEREGAFSQTRDGAFRIVLDHRPAFAALNAATGAQLQLSGHTHGGHILGMDRLVGRFNAGYIRGWYQLGQMDCYVNNGAGLWNGFPLRLGVPAEIALLTLRAV